MLKNLPYALSFFLLSCAGVVDSKDPVTKSAKLAASNTYPIKELTFGDSLEEGWGADIRLSIVQITSTDSSKLYKAISSYKGGNLGLSVEIPKVHGKKGFGAGMKLSGIGSESDYLLTTLALLYKQQSDTQLKFADLISVNYVSLNDLVESIGGQYGEEDDKTFYYELFFEGEGDDNYAEVYINVNPVEQWLEIREKDEGYRSALIRFLKKNRQSESK